MPPIPSRPFLPFVCAAVLLPLMSGCGNRGANNVNVFSASAETGQKGKGGSSTRGNKGKAAKTTASVDTTSPILPNHAKTPGTAYPDTPQTLKDVCTSGYTSKIRNVPQSVKEAVYKSYGITHRKPGQYEIDHLVSLELGGTNSQDNLWPQSYDTQPWNARVKDQLENELHEELCDGTITLAQAQQEVKTDWIASYKKHFHTDLPLASKNKRKQGGKPAPDASADEDETPATADVPAAAKSSDVWVNLNSGVYWQPGTRYYGKTNKGKYQSEAAAKKEGFRAAKD